MTSFHQIRLFAICVVVLSSSVALIAQPGHKDNPGNGGSPPGQAKKQEKGLPPGQAKRLEEGKGLPPGQAKKYFRDQDRDPFYAHYRNDADRWRGRRRPIVVIGQPIAQIYTIQLVPRSVWVNVIAPPPPGYQYGYYGGYVVAYSPTTRMVADVLDLIDAARSR